MMNRIILIGFHLACICLSGAVASGQTGDTPVLTVHNKGIGGQNSQQGKARFAKDVLSLQPDYVFIYFGLNDTLNEPRFLSEKEYITNLSWMVDQAEKAGIVPVICTIHPVEEVALMKRHKKESYGAVGPNGKIDRYNKALRVWAESKGVSIADFAEVVATTDQPDERLVNNDGVHLTPLGHQALAKCFFDGVAAKLKGKITIVCLGDSVTWGAGVKGSGTTSGETYPSYLGQLSEPDRKFVSEHSSVQSSDAEEAVFDRIRRVHGKHADELFESVLRSKRIAPLQGGFAHLWLNRDIAEGNRLIREAYKAIITNEGGTGVMTPEIASSEHVKWQMRTWNRIYQLYNDKSRFYPGRLGKETQTMIEEMFWLYVCDKSRIERAAPQHVWGIHGSENHEMMHYSNALLALQALKKSPTYKDRKLPDGRRPVEHYQAWNAYYKLYCVERAKHGLLIEFFSAYGKYTMPELFNMYDLAEDPVLRSRMGKLLDLIWADWSLSQVNGVRGGGRLRLYQGNTAKPESAYGWGAGDIWFSMSRFLLDSGNWWNAGSYHPSPIIGYPWVLATTQYRLPDVIIDIAKDAEGLGEYNYVARRVAKQRRTAAKDVPVTFSPWYALDPEDNRMVSYDHCTPDYVMGSLMIDPTLPHASSNDYLKGNDLPEGYPPLTAQNRYYCIVFASDVNARIVPQCEGLANGKTYGEQQAVQHDNVLLVQRHAKAKQTGDMRILFGLKGMKGRLTERDGWLILREGNAWLGIKGFSRTEPNESCGHKWDNEVFLRMNDGNAPVALIAGRSTDFPDTDAFASYLGSFSGTPKDGWFEIKNEKVSLALEMNSKAFPKVNDTPIDLSPRMLFDSPFLSSEQGSGIVTIRKGGRELRIKMDE